MNETLDKSKQISFSPTLVRISVGTLVRTSVGTLVRTSVGTLVRTSVGTLVRISVGTQLCLQTKLSLLKSTSKILNYYTKLSTFLSVYRFPQLKFEANRSKVLRVIIGHSNSNFIDKV